MRQKIEIENIRRFLNSINLEETKFNDSSRAELIQKAKRFNIKPHHTNKIFNKLKEDDDTEESTDEETKEFTDTSVSLQHFKEYNMDTPKKPVINDSIVGFRDRSEALPDKQKRMGWTINTEVETYSRLQKKWIPSTIIKVFKDNDQEWLLVKCN
eukprot:315779_1